MSSFASAADAYTESSVLTASPERLVVMLYDGLLKFTGRAEIALGEGNVQAAAVAFKRAHAILDELLATLDPEAGQIAERLQSIYLFCSRLLTEGQLGQDPAKVAQVLPLVRELRGAWAEIADRADRADS